MSSLNIYLVVGSIFGLVFGLVVGLIFNLPHIKSLNSFILRVPIDLLQLPQIALKLSIVSVPPLDSARICPHSKLKAVISF